jgi:uncharacterized protein (DUF3084 family)
MRPCAFCVALGVLCVVSLEDARCEQCYRSHRSCELAPSWAEADKVYKELDKVHAKFLKAEVKVLKAQAKALRLRKQKRLLQKRLRALGDQEKQNILNLEMNKAAAEALKSSVEEQP